MKMTQVQKIQSKIGYEFVNPNLLNQAFTRKSYAEEHKNVQSNVVLEFYGDKAMELIVMKKMCKAFGRIEEDDFYHSTKEKDALHVVREKNVCGVNLAEKIKNLGWYEYLQMGKGEILQKANKESSVQENLFEAIIGAVAIDSDWNMDALDKAVSSMLELEL